MKSVFLIALSFVCWDLQTFAQGKELIEGSSQAKTHTQKQLKVQLNAPRFLRQGDQIEFSARIVNPSGKEFTGQAELQLMDASTHQPVDGWFQNIFPNQYFTVAAGGSEEVKFPIAVPYQFNSALVLRVVAKAGSYSDGEDVILPVLTNQTLVTETLPLTLIGADSKNFTFESLLHSGNRESLQQQSLTVEFTSNPAWYAVQALPYLLDGPYECAEQIFNRFYANAVATRIESEFPRSRQVFDSRKTSDTTELRSSFQKNQELKSNVQKLKNMQSANGGFAWFKGGPDDRYMTQYLLTGIGHLKKLNALPGEQLANLEPILDLALPYLDRKLKDDYDGLVKRKINLKTQSIDYIQAQYLYMRSFFADRKLPASCQTAFNYYQSQAKQNWMNGNPFMKGMIALALHRAGDQQTPLAILSSLKQTAIRSEEMGMYWKQADARNGWFWWQAPVETQSLLIEVFSEINHDARTVNELKTWLLRHKQTNNWGTTKATADACFALLLQDSDWFKNESRVLIRLGNTTLSSRDDQALAGTGYFKQSIPASMIRPEMGKINVSVTADPSTHGEKPGVQYGALYWQYFEDLDPIRPASTPLQLNKKLLLEKNTGNGPVFQPIDEGTTVKVGDQVKVRIELRVDRDMEYVHMKDVWASALEPVHVPSGFQWQGGLGYYQSTTDASTHFFFSYLRKGTYVFEYPLFVTQAGTFSAGITTIQSMYAPEFSAHSEGVRLKSE